MFTSRILLTLSLLVAPLSYANTPAMPELSEQEIQMLEQQMEQAMEAIRQVGGLYIVNIEALPSRSKIAVIKALKEAAKSPHCDELFEMPEPHTIVFKGEQGKAEAAKLIQTLEKLGCKAELLELN